VIQGSFRGQILGNTTMNLRVPRSTVLHWISESSLLLLQILANIIDCSDRRLFFIYIHTLVEYTVMAILANTNGKMFSTLMVPMAVLCVV
jgi:hypothetical protein